MDLLQGAQRVAAELRRAGYEAHFAGGCVRDRLLGKSPKDYDIVTSARPEEVGQVFRRTLMVGAAFGVVRVLWQKGLEYEVATYRSDGQYLDGRRPETIEYSKDKQEDVKRRDFTINALLEDPETGEVLDYVGGRADLAAGLVRAVGDPERRFAEDRLRLLRAVRFAARFGFQIEDATWAALRAHADQINVVSKERIVVELHALWTGPRPGPGTRLLLESGLFGALFPWWQPEPGRAREGWPWAIEPLAERPGLAEHTWLVALWSLVLPQCAEREAEALLRDFRHSRELIRDVLAVRRRAAAFTAPGQLEPWERRELVSEPISRASVLRLELLGLETSEARTLWAAAQAELEAAPLPEGPLVTGADLMALGLTPGPEFKRLLRLVDEGVFKRELGTREEALAAVARWVTP